MTDEFVENAIQAADEDSGDFEPGPAVDHFVPHGDDVGVTELASQLAQSHARPPLLDVARRRFINTVQKVPTAGRAGLAAV